MPHQKYSWNNKDSRHIEYHQMIPKSISQEISETCQKPRIQSILIYMLVRPHNPLDYFGQSKIQKHFNIHAGTETFPKKNISKNYPTILKNIYVQQYPTIPNHTQHESKDLVLGFNLQFLDCFGDGVGFQPAAIDPNAAMPASSGTGPVILKRKLRLQKQCFSMFFHLCSHRF